MPSSRVSKFFPTEGIIHLSNAVYNSLFFLSTTTYFINKDSVVSRMEFAQNGNNRKLSKQSYSNL